MYNPYGETFLPLNLARLRLHLTERRRHVLENTCSGCDSGPFDRSLRRCDGVGSRCGFLHLQYAADIRLHQDGLCDAGTADPDTDPGYRGDRCPFQETQVALPFKSAWSWQHFYQLQAELY